MQYWLMKSEPGVWSWSDQLKAGEHGADWDGVRNYQASNNLKKMKKGDLAFFYHSQDERAIVGIVKIVKEYFPDPSDPKKRFGMVKVAAVKKVPFPVKLAEIKADKRLSHLALVRQSRLSVMPIDSKSWNLICKMGKINNR